MGTGQVRCRVVAGRQGDSPRWHSGGNTHSECIWPGRYNLHTWTRGWGTVPYWNAFAAVLELRGIGTFFDARLDDTNKWPIAATFRFGHTSIDNPDVDLVTSKLPALQVFQLSIPAPKATPGVDFDQTAAKRRDALFSGKGQLHQLPPRADLHGTQLE